MGRGMFAPAIPPAWRVEAAATARLASPMILTNLSQAAIHTTDVVLLGWLGRGRWRRVRWAAISTSRF
ncbi:hypothetical protein [Sphingomonas changnyeongensis]|uniref:hypothetical protein n=1 Tax=Sphingomonas changnyeongensis TaxID=2698679 RepID=UPI00389ABB9E